MLLNFLNKSYMLELVGDAHLKQKVSRSTACDLSGS